MKQSLVYIVTPTFNASKYVLSFLESIKNQSHLNLKVIIVDDASSDSTVKLIHQSHPETIVLNGTGDLWWSGCTNKGVDYALKNGADYIMTVNVDVELEKNCVSSLVKVAQNLPKTLVGATVCDQKNKAKVWYFGGYWDRRGGDLKHAIGKYQELPDELQRPEWLTGMGVLIPAHAFHSRRYDQVRFPQYFGDADFSLRAAKSGLGLAVTKQAIVYADLSSSWLEKWLAKPNLGFGFKLLFSKRSQYNLKARFLFYRRHWGKGYLRALLRLYFISLFKLYRLWTVLIIKRLLGRI